MNRQSRSASAWLALATICILAATTSATASIAQVVDRGLYSRLTVKMSEVVPRQHCHRALNNLEVSLYSFAFEKLENLASQPATGMQKTAH